LINHQKILELLPWFVNGTLQGDEQSLVSEHILDCSECHRAMESLTETAKLLHATKEPTTESIAHVRDDFLKQLEDRGDKTKLPFTWMIPTTIAACLLIAVLLFNPTFRQKESFETLGSTLSGEGSVLQIIFHPDVQEMSIQILLPSDQGNIVSGPTAQGVYRFQLVKDVDSQQVLAWLRNHPDVKFAAMEAGQ
jgi:hypothetical protein